MTDKEVIQICINRYQSVYDTIIQPEFLVDVGRTKSFLFIQNAHEGVCTFLSRTNLHLDIRLINRKANFHRSFKLYWYLKPSFLFSTKEILLSIKYRLDKLKEIINEINNQENI